MKDEKHSVKKWIYWFSLAIAIIIVYNLIGNITGVGKWILNLIDILRPFCLGILIAYILYLPCRHIENLFSKTRK